MMTTSSAPRSRRSPFAVLGILALAGGVGLAGSHTLLAQDKSESRPRLSQPEALKHAYGLSDAFKAVSRSIEPSVVNIRSTQRLQASANQGQSPMPPFDDDLLRRFFGGEIPDGFQMQPTPQPRERSGEGSGVIMREDGYIVTNNHVVAAATEITITLASGGEYTGTVVGTDPDTDLAVIKIDASGLQPASFGDSDAVDVGEWVLAIGSPFGLRHTVTAGIVSAKGRGNMGLAAFEDFIQTDAAINPGNSGGPLVSLEGDVIGINTAISTRTGAYNGIGFAIPSNMVRTVFESIVESGGVKRGALGVGIGPLTPKVAEHYGFEGRNGVVINQVYPDSAAEKAGLKVGDIITQIDGQATNDNRVLLNTIGRHGPGEVITVTVFRDGKSRTFDVTLGDRSVQFASLNSGRGRPTPQGEQPSTGGPDLGITVERLTPEIAQQLNAADRKGVVIVSVEPGSPAAEEGLQRGDIVAMVGDKSVATPEEFHSVLSNTDASKGVALQVFRGELAQLVVLKPGSAESDRD